MSDITNLLNSGPSSQRVDIVIVAEGYTQAERAKFLADANVFLNTFLGDSNAKLNAPFSNYKGLFNANALFVASAQSGTDQPNQGIFVDTYFNATQHGDDGRLLYGDTSKVQTVISQALANDAHELTIVLVNTPLYGGAGGAIAWASADSSQSPELALHEIGHSFAGLQDEYVDTSVANDFPFSATAFKNSSHVTDSLNRIPWKDWLGYVDPDLGVVGTFEGGYYRAKGVWRATQTSKMLALDQPFSPPEKEAFALKYYEAIGDYLSVTSIIPGVYQAITPNNSLYSYTWKTNGAAVKGGFQFDAYGSGSYQQNGNLTLTTQDNTSIIRKNLNATQQIETISLNSPIKNIADNTYTLQSSDHGSVLQFSAANNVISVDELNTTQRVYLDGGAGLDTLQLNGKLTDATHFSIQQMQNGTLLLGTQGTINFATHQIENLQFQDFTVNTNIHTNAATISKSELRSIEELYVAYFNRVPDADGLNYWINRYKDGMTLRQIADSFYFSALLYPDQTGYTETMTNTDFINIIYKNALARKDGADLEGLTYWSNTLKSGQETRGTLLLSILNGAHQYKGDATWGWMVDLLDNKIAVADKFAVEWGLNYLTPEASITNGIKIASLVTPTDISLAINLIGISEGQIQFLG